MAAEIEVVEENLSFFFPAHWTVEKFDREGGFAGGLSYPELHKVDIVALGDGMLWLIEVKDYRRDKFVRVKRHRKKNKEPLEVEFVSKIRDSVAIMVAARRRDCVEFLPICDHLLRPHCHDAKAMLFVERDADWYRTPKGYNSKQNTVNYVKPRLRALGIDTLVGDRASVNGALSWRVESRSMRPNP